MKRRWVYTEGGRPLAEPLEVTKDAQAPARLEVVTGNLYDGQRALDGTDVSTRRRFEEYLRRTGCALADDFKGEWAAAAKAREAALSGRQRNPKLREQIGRAAYQLETKRRR